MNIKISKKFKSSNFDNRENNPKIKYIIIHYTETDSLLEAIEILCSPKRKVSCHYVLDKDGSIYNLINDSKRAWHAGVSFWKKIKNLNNSSIGIEVVNKGELKKEEYTKPQIESLINLLKFLKKKHQIKKENFLGHSDVAPSRKIDPGVFFPWKKLSDSSLGNWFEVEGSNKNFYQELNGNDFLIFIKNLRKIGYSEVKNSQSFKKNQKIINSFHRHHLPKLLNKKPTYLSLLKTNGLLDLTKN